MALFRKQAIAQQHSYMWGEVSINRSLKNDTLFALFLSLFGCIILFLFVGEYNQKETVIGLLEPSKGIVETRSPKSGVVTVVFVSEGDLVSKGDPLFQISNESSIVPGLSSNKVKLAHLNRRKEIIGQLKQNKNLAYSDFLKSNSNKTAIVKQKLALLNSESELLKKELLLSENEVSRQKALSKQLLSTKTVENRAVEKLMSIKHKVSNHQLKILDLENTLTTLNSSTLDLVSRKNDSLFELDTQLLSLEEEITRQQVAHSIIVNAQSNGVVSSLNLEVGMPVSQNEYLASILPANDILVAKLFIPTRAIGFVSINQDVVLKLDAFPYQKYGPVLASLTSVSSNVLAGSKSHPLLSMSEPVYKSVASLKEQYIRINNNDVTLQAGMLFSAEIIISKRTLAEWLFAPIIGALK